MPRPYFHKLILSRTLQERKLRIPDNFYKKFGKDLATFVRLTVPGGHLWRIGLLKVDDKIWLSDHWQEFVDRYSIRVGHFLVFRYEGNAVFDVHIFDLSASEINYQTNGLIGKRSFVFEDMDDGENGESFGSLAMQNLFNDSKPVSGISWAGEGNVQIHKAANVPNSTHTCDGSFQNSVVKKKKSADDAALYGFGEEKPKKKRGRKKKNINPVEEKEQPTHDEDESDSRPGNYASASARKRTVTAEERERAIKAAKAFEPMNPFCRVVLRPSYLYRGCIMYLPSGFAEKHLNGVSGFIRLQYNEKQWPVRCLYRSGRAKFSQGWYEFTLENNIGEGDVCVFELLKSRDIVLKVTVFRVLEHAGFMGRP